MAALLCTRLQGWLAGRLTRPLTRREGFAIRGLEDCSVFLLDNSSEVEVSNCVNCQIFIGPVDGPAIFDNCSNCQVAVACQQVGARG